MAYGKLNTDAYTIALWRMNESSWNGTSGEVTDETGSHDGTSSGASISNSGKFNNGGSFDGSNDYITVPHSTDFNFGSNPFSYEAWINISSVGQRERLYSKWGSSGNREIEIYIDDTSSEGFSCFLQGGATQLNFTKEITWSTGVWYYIAFVRDGNDFTFYVNGAQLGSTDTNAITLNSGTANVSLGSSQGSANFFHGLMDEVRVSSAARSAKEIREYYAKAKGAYAAKLI
jgi:hypothetical protein